jgi:hypothetical protein
MDARRFDTLARTVSLGPSRRRVLAFLSGGLLEALTLARPDAAAAKKKKKKKKKKKGPSGPGPSPAAPPPGPVNPCDVTVLPGEDLQAVISNADTSSRRFTICLLGGTYSLVGPDSGAEDLVIVGQITLLGAGQGQTILQGSGALGRTVVASRVGDVQLSDLTIRGGNGGSGGGVANSDTLTMTNCTITGNAAAHGGGIFSGGSEDFSTVTLIGCTISGNSAFTGNKIGSGGGIWNLANVSMTDTTISDNQADIAGAIFNDTDGTVTFGTGNTISGNTSTEGGPGCVGVTC